MKKMLLVITVLIGSMVYSSCSKDEDKVSTNYKEAIVGTWTVTYNDYYGTNTETITFNGTNMYFEAQCPVKDHIKTYRGNYSVVDNVITLSESTNKYPLEVIVITDMTESSFIGKWDFGEVKGTRVR